MTESIENILKEGYRTWRKNLILGVPFLLSSIVTLLVIFATLLLSILMSIPFFSQMMGNMQEGMPNMLLAFLLLVLLFTITIFLITLINAFFSAGAIGMAQKAIKTGKTTLSEMIYYGKKKFLSLFFAYIIIFLITILGFLFFIPAVIAFLLKVINVGISLLVFGFATWMLYHLALNIILILVSYAIVVGDLGAIEGIKEGYRLVMKNKLSVVFLFFVTQALLWGCGLVISVITSLMNVIPLLGIFINLGIWVLYIIFIVVVITPLFMVWWTHLYMDGTGMKPKEIPTELPTTSVQAPEIPTHEPIYV